MTIMVALYALLAIVSFVDFLVKLCSEDSKTVNEFLSNLPIENIKVHRDYLVLLQVCLSAILFIFIFFKGQLQKIRDF